MNWHVSQWIEDAQRWENVGPGQSEENAMRLLNLLVWAGKMVRCWKE